MSQALLDAARSAFRAEFAAEPRSAALAPARVELLGNHTDYNGGLVLAAAIDRFTVVAGAPSNRPGECRVHSTSFGQTTTFYRSNLERGEPGSWSRYVRGVLWSIGERFEVQAGFNAAIAGNVPLGAGLSSSASLQAAVAMYLFADGIIEASPVISPHGNALDDEARMAIARLLQRSENEFVGVGSGLLDQFSVLFGRAGHALLLDCDSFAFERLPMGDPPAAIVVCDSKTSRRLADGMYNRRRSECERVVAFYQAQRGPEAVRWLRDVTLEDLERDWDHLDPVGRRRARHVLTENERVRQGAEALKRGDLPAFGRLMSESHASSRDDFENSAPALDALIDAARHAPGSLGGKLSGAGWAGCTVNLVEATQAESFAESVQAAYLQSTGSSPEIHVCHPAEGARGVRLDPPEPV